MGLASAIFFTLAVNALGQPKTINKIDIFDEINIRTKGGRLEFSIYNEGNNAVLRGEFGRSLPKETKEQIQVCSDDPANCLEFGNIRLTTIKDDHCYYFNWTTPGNLTLEDCFDYGTDKWFGGPENTVQYWPFNNMTFKDWPYDVNHRLSQGVAEPYWVTSSGFYVFVDKKTPLFIDANNVYSNGLCLVSKQYPPYLPRGGTYLGYKVCAYTDVREAHINAVRTDLGTPTGIPDPWMIKHPVWSTWARYKKDINDTIVKWFAQEINKQGFNNSQIEIDDNWESCYGNAEFNVSRFADMPALGKYLHSIGFRITLWNHMFVNVECDLFSELKRRGFLVQSQDGSVETTWWDGTAGVVDFTNPEAARWFLNYRRDMMRQNHIDGLKLDAGEPSWLPQIPKLNADLLDQPNAFTSSYVRTVAQFGPLTEVRVGHNSQDLPIFVRMLDKDSHWSFSNGLPTLLTTLFTMNLAGYTLVLPDMVGGNGYGNDTVSKELFIRWLQANTFMPCIQLSVAPFDFDKETIDISKQFTTLHAEYSGRIIAAMKKCVRYGTPVNAPIWWVAPTDPTALAIWDEYLLGERILVAPVVEKGATQRDVYLPCGRWRDEAYPDHKVYQGPRWLRNYPAPLHVLPYFTRVGKCKQTDGQGGR